MARAAAIGLVAATGFLLLVSLVVSAALAAVATWVGGLMPGMAQLLNLANFAVSFLMVTLLFAAIYKILPDRQLRWRDVAVGSAVTAMLFTIGKTLIGWYIGGTGIASTYGAAGALMVVLVWVYYSSQIFLLGAEFTKVWAIHYGSMAGQAEQVKAPQGTPAALAVPASPAPAVGVQVARHAARHAPVRWLDVVAVAGVLFAMIRPPRPR